MSVLIKGMEMPTSCLKGGCPLDGFSCQLWEDKYWDDWKDPEKMRHPNCPLVPIPPHGRLIDADALMQQIEHDTPLSAVFEKTMRRYLHNAPTIIEAEEGE